MNINGRNGLACTTAIEDLSGEVRITPLPQIIIDIFNYIAVARVVLHGLRGALHVHHTHPRTARDCQGNHLRISGQPGYIVDDLDSLCQSSLCHGSLGSVDRHGHARFGCKPPNDICHPCEFFGLAHRIRVGPRTLAPDIEDIHSLSEHLFGACEGALEVGIASAVVKTVRREI